MEGRLLHAEIALRHQVLRADRAARDELERVRVLELAKPERFHVVHTRQQRGVFRHRSRSRTDPRTTDCGIEPTGGNIVIGRGRDVNAEQLQEAQRRLGQTDEELAESLDVSPDTVRAWAAGRTTVPRRHAQQLMWLTAGAERAAALRSSGLPECDWLLAYEAEPFPDDPDAALKHMEKLNRHAEVCQMCIARQQFVAERFGPMPALPQSGWMRVFFWVERVPSWARPAAVGAAILAAIVSVRVIFALPQLISAPSNFGEALLAVAAAAGAGAAGGFAYSLTRPTLRRLGRLGDYFTGIVCVFAYVGALAVVAPLAFGEPLIKDQASLIIFAVASVFFGLVVGHSWFRGQ
jgi:hypothetical protein